jgi:hypothetical protein
LNDPAIGPRSSTGQLAAEKNRIQIMLATSIISTA